MAVPPGTPQRQNPTQGMAVPEGMRAVPIPIASAEWPTLIFPYPLSEEAFAEMKGMLESMKSAFTAKHARPQNGDQPDVNE